jgi:hypothetical protein
MRLGMLVLLGTGLIGVSLILVVAGSGREAAGGPLPLLAAGASGADCLYLAPGPGGACLLRSKPAESNRAPWVVRVLPPARAFSLPATNGRAWVLTNSPWSRSNVWIFPRGARPFGPGRGPVAPPVAPPGVYESEPYKGIVVVPGPQWDDRCLTFGGDWTAPMPVVKPDLRLIPRASQPAVSQATGRGKVAEK